jgi:thiamine biosynthesis protein ThiS
LKSQDCENPDKMKLQINGEARDFTSPLSLASLVEQLGMKHDRVAVELNRDIVPREQWAETQLGEGDRLEIVHFVGGGLPLNSDSRELL